MKVFFLLRNKAWCTLLTLVTCIQVVNMSINAENSSSTLEDRTINEIETCVEFVVELVMGHENAIGESDGDAENTAHKPGQHFVLMLTQIDTPRLITYATNLPKALTVCDINEVTGHSSVTYPPPKSALGKLQRA